MKELYMIVRIVNILAEMKDGSPMITEPCYQIVEKDFQMIDQAFNVKSSYRESQNYIIVKYWV